MSETYLEIGDEDGNPFNISAQKVLSGRTAIIGMSGAGKSHLVGVICEELAENDLPFVIIDPEGEYASLKEKYEVVWAANNPKADVRLRTQGMEKLASAVVEHRARLVIDTSNSSNELEVVSRFLNEFYSIESEKKEPIAVIVEEADRFAPQSSGDVVEELYEISRRGRKRGIGLIIATQRPAMVDKNVLSQCGNQFIGRLRSERDLNAVSLFFSRSKDVKSLPELERGSFFVMGDISPTPALVHIKERKTSSIGSTPELKGKKKFSMEEFIKEVSPSRKEKKAVKQDEKTATSGGKREQVTTDKTEVKEEHRPKSRSRKPASPSSTKKVEKKAIPALPFSINQEEALSIAAKSIPLTLVFRGKPTESIEHSQMVYWPYIICQVDVAERGFLKKLNIRTLKTIWDPVSVTAVRFEGMEAIPLHGFDKKLDGLKWKEIRVLRELTRDDMTVSDLVPATGLTVGEVRGAIGKLKKKRRIVEGGKVGRATLYRPIIKLQAISLDSIETQVPESGLIVPPDNVQILDAPLGDKFFINLIKGLFENCEVSDTFYFYVPYYIVSLRKKRGSKERKLLINAITGSVREMEKGVRLP